MNNWPAVDNWLDLLGNLWIGLVLILVAAVPSYFAHRNHQSLKEIKGQVVNGHGEGQPLRGDIDHIMAIIELLRESLADERTVRHDQIGELREDIDARFRALNHRITPML